MGGSEQAFVTGGLAVSLHLTDSLSVCNCHWLIDWLNGEQTSRYPWVCAGSVFSVCAMHFSENMEKGEANSGIRWNEAGNQAVALRRMMMIEKSIASLLVLTTLAKLHLLIYFTPLWKLTQDHALLWDGMLHMRHCWTVRRGKRVIQCDPTLRLPVRWCSQELPFPLYHQC